jgi:hypothetical protein
MLPLPAKDRVAKVRPSHCHLLAGHQILTLPSGTATSADRELPPI